MTTIFIRTVLIYLLLLIAMRMMGKRQIGELEISDLITTLLISEIASLPITDGDIPFSHAVIPIVTLMTFEVVSSTLVANLPIVKNLITARPATLIDDGELRPSELKKSRISTDELISELRQKGITNLSEVRYAILEQNGKISVIPYEEHQPPTKRELGLATREEGLFHMVIDKGVINRHSLKRLNIRKEELLGELSAKGLTPKDVYVLFISDSGERQILKKSEVYRTK